MKQKYHPSKFLLWIPAFILAIFLVTPQIAYAADYYTEGNFQYAISGESITIHSYFGSEESVVIPAMVAGLPVTAIDDFAFAGCTSAISITIPDTVTSVGNSSFTGAKNLQKIYNQSKSITPKAGEQVLVIEDYPMYAPEQTQGGTNTTDKDSVTEHESDQTDSDSDDGKITNKNDSKNTSSQDETSGTANNSTNQEAVNGKDNGFQVEAEEVDDEKDSTVPIPNSDQVLSVDDSKNLILIDKDGNITVLDRNQDYAIAHKGDGTITIVDADGNEIQIEDGTIKNRNGDTLTTIAGSNEINSDKNKTSKKSQMGYLVLGAVIVVAIVGAIIYFRRRKQINE